MHKEHRKGEVFTFRLMWIAARRQIDNARRHKIGSINDLMAALTFSAFAFEAYINFCGSRLFPSEWKERVGIEKKSSKILSRLNFQKIKDSEEGRILFGTKEFRDELAHGRPLYIDNKVEVDDSNPESLFYKIPLYENTIITNAEQTSFALDCVEQLIEKIHSAMQREPDVSYIPGRSALRGPLHIVGFRMIP